MAAPHRPRAHMNSLLRSVAVVVLVSLPAWAGPQVLLFPAVGQPTELTVHGRVLKDAPTKGSNVLSRNLRRLTAPNWEGAPVEVSYRGIHVKTKSGDDGIFEATFKLPPELAAKPGVEEIEARVPGAAARAPVRIVDDAVPFFVISDFDDTVAVTNVIRRRGLVKAALLQDSDTQPVVVGMSDFYQCLIEERAPVTGLAFVSGSPHQYGPRITKFLGNNKFPFAGLYLRDLGPDTLSGYKQPVIRNLLARMKQKVILVGDSGEADPEVYAQIRKEFPDRVLQIYIRDAGRTEDATRFKDMMVFKDAKGAAAHAAKAGYLSQACFDQRFGADAK